LQNFRLTFQVTDVFATQISETEGFAGLQKCGGTKCHKGACADWHFVEPEGANSTRSSYRLLNAVPITISF